MTRIDGDLEVACYFKAVEDAIELAIKAAQDGLVVVSAVSMVRAQFILAHALGGLEKITDVPWTALPIDPSVGA